MCLRCTVLHYKLKFDKLYAIFIEAFPLLRYVCKHHDVQFCHPFHVAYMLVI